jgi:hypothetical protein
VIAHGEAVAWAWLGCGAVREETGSAVGQCGGVRARGTVNATAAAGCDGGASGSCTKRRHGGRKGKGDPRVLYRRFLGGAWLTPAAGGNGGKGGGGGAHRRDWSRGCSGQR